MLAHHPHVRYRRLALVMANLPPELPPLSPDADLCGNCAGFRAFRPDAPCGGRCADPESPRFKNLLTRSVAACAVFHPAAQRQLAV